MPVGGGTSLGAAQGRITIDTSSLQGVVATTQQVGQQAQRNLGQIGAGAARAQSNLSGLSGAFRQLSGAFGVSLGIGAVVQLGRLAVQLDEVATAYRRQQVAAVSLAGSQAKLNELLAAYDKATGGAIDKATALADVTRLQAVGFADSAEELEQFARAARGISVATGQNQDYIISQLQLAIANQSTMRLDQLGLGVGEVKQRIDELRASNGNLTTEMAYQQAILGLADQKFGELAKSAEASATGMEQAAKAWKDLQLAIGEATAGPLDFLGKGLALFIDVQTARLKAWIAELDAYVKLLRQLGMAGPWLTTSESQFVSGSSGRDRGRHGGGTPSAGPAVPDAAAQKLLAAQLDYARGLEEVARDTGSAIQETTERYSRQRAETIRSYELGIAREAEDFGRSRARQQRDYERSLVQMMRDSREREAEAQAELNERTADLRQRTGRRIAEMEADYARQRERAQAEHRDRLLSAAGRLDAIALLEEQKSFARAQREAKEDRDERLDRERRTLRESIDQAQKAHNEQLEDARQADARRREEMAAALARQRADEDEDRTIRQARAREEHEQTLAQQDADHQADLARIAAEEAERVEIVTQAFDDEMIALGQHNAAVEAERRRAQNAELKAIEPFTKQWFATLRESMAAASPNYPSNADPYIDRTAPSLLRSGGSSGGGGSVTIQSGAIAIYAAPGMDEERVGEIVEEKLTELLEGT